MATATVPPDTFEQLYTDHRDRLYRALVIATDDRDLSLDAVDGAFVARRRRIRRDDTAAAGPHILRRALAKVSRARSDDMRGFRLPDATASSQATAALEEVRKLDLTDRVIVICAAYLGWDPGEIATAVSLEGPAVELRRRAATDAVAAGLGVDPAGIARRLGDALTEIAEGISPPLSRLESVRSEGAAQRALLAVGGLAAVAVLVGAGFFGWKALQGEPGEEVAAPPTGASTEAPQITGETVEWEQSGTPLPDAELNQLTAGPDGFVAIGYDYSDPSGQGIMAMRSEDGFDWDAVDLPIARRGGGWIASLVYEAGRYVAVGSSFDDRTGTESPQLYLSEDGEAWDTVAVPIESEVVVDDVDLTVSTSLQNAAVRGDEIVIIGSQYAQVDIMPLIRDNLPEGVSTNGGWGFSAQGMEFYDNQGNVAHRATFEELGLSPELASYFSHGRPVAMVTDDGGETWDEIPTTDLMASRGYIGQLGLVEGGMVALAVPDTGGGELWAGDGESWERVELERGIIPSSLAQAGDTLYLVAGIETGARSALFRSTDGREWEEVVDDDLAGIYVDRIISSEHGLVALGQPVDARHRAGPAVVEKDGLIVEISETGLHLVKDAAGETIVEAYHEDIERSGSTLTIIDPKTGDEVVTLDLAEIDAAWQAVFNSVELAPAQQQTAAAVSRDGEAWTAVATGDALPAGFMPQSAALGPSALMLTGWIEGGSTPGPVIFVGTFGS